MRRRGLMLALAAPAVLARAQAVWPQYPVRVLVGFAPGGLTDVLARVMSTRLAAQLGQPFVVENRPGASGIIGAEAVAKATDGHTLLMGHPTALAIAPAFAQRLPFDAERAFAYITLLALQPHLLLVREDAPWRDVAALVAAGRAKEGALTFASSGVGSVQHVQGEQFCAAARFTGVHVPYRGSAPTMTDLAAGQVDFVIDGVGVARPLMEAGKLRALATSHARRVAALPEVPTLAEAGISGVVPGSWFGFVAPASMPAETVRALREACVAALSSAEVTRALANASAEAVGNTPDAFRGFVQAQIAGFRELAKRTVISFE